MNEQELEKSNRSKYGEKSKDIISEAYEMEQWAGDFWCVFNVFRYLKRYIRKGSTKAGNLTDLIKARDYLNRAIEAHPDNDKELKEVVEK